MSVKIQNDKITIIVKGVRPGEMVIFRGINDNMIFPYPSYLGVYKYEVKIRARTRGKYLFWVRTKPKKLTKGLYKFLRRHKELTKNHSNFFIIKY